MLSVIRELSRSGGLLAFDGCPGVVVRYDGALELSEDALEETVRQLFDIGVRTAIAHVDAGELQDIAYADIRAAMEARSIEVIHCPIPDFSIPDDRIELEMEPVWEMAALRIARGEGVFLHCLAGDGRSALMAGCLLVRLGMSGVEALDAVRGARPNAIETDQQLAYLINQPVGTKVRSR